jgi:hypothetical protein
MLLLISRRFIPAAFIATVLCGLVYGVTQQSLRGNANDPQIRLAEDAAAELAAGTPVMNVVSFSASSTPVDIETSADPYVLAFDQSGAPIIGNGFLRGSLARLPLGVFNYVMAHGEERVTWEPTPGVRQAAVIVKMQNPNSAIGFVLAGRSLRDTENRIDSMGDIIAGAWFFLIGGLLILELFFAAIESPRKKRR